LTMSRIFSSTKIFSLICMYHFTSLGYHISSHLITFT
jgi:hypothetical protein